MGPRAACRYSTFAPAVLETVGALDEPEPVAWAVLLVIRPVAVPVEEELFPEEVAV